MQKRAENISRFTSFMDDGWLYQAVEATERMQQQGISISRDNVYGLLQECEKRKDLICGRRVQALMVHGGLDCVSLLGDHLIRLFTYYDGSNEANQTFNKISKPSPHTWAATISANAKLGHGQTAIELSWKLQLSGMDFNKYILVAVLKACTMKKTLTEGRIFHDQIIGQDLQSEVAVGSTLVDMYSKCGSLEEACKTFHNLPTRDIVSWGIMIAGYAQRGESVLALECFEKMQQEGIEPNLVIWGAMISGFAQHGHGHLALHCFEGMRQEGLEPGIVILLGVLKACGSIGAIEQGRLLHEQILDKALHCDLSLGSSLVDMYAKCGGLEEAHIIFDSLPNRDIVTWAAIIAAFAQHGEGLMSLDLHKKMQQEGIHSDEFTLSSALKACANIGAVMEGRLIHESILGSGFQYNAVVRSALVDVYAKGGRFYEALKVLLELPNRDVISWSALIAGYAKHGEGCKALDCFEKMQQIGIVQNEVTFLAALKACTSLDGLEQGRIIHEEIIERGYQSDVSLGNTVIDMYAKCGSIEEAFKNFQNLLQRDVVSWGAIVAAYAQHGDCLSALKCFEDMRCGGLKPNEVTFLSILKACALEGALEESRLIHAQIIEAGKQADPMIGNTLVDMYAKCGSLPEACDVFSTLPNRTEVSWCAMIGGYAQHNEGLLALKCFQHMQEEGIEATEVTFLTVLKACAIMGAIEQARTIHQRLLQHGLPVNIVVASSLVDMYMKCGSLGDANVIFDDLQHRDVVLWNGMVAAYAMHGESRLAIECFKRMQLENIDPDEVTFTSILIACSRSGLVDEGRWYFQSMKQNHCIAHNSSHYNCIVDLLGRSGYLLEAEDLLQDAMQTYIVGWTSLLGSCRMHGDLDVGGRCFDRIVSLNFHSTSGYVLMSNICADMLMLENRCKV